MIRTRRSAMALVVLLASISAQVGAAHVGIGVRGGVSLGRLSGGGAPSGGLDAGFRPGLVAGIFTDLRLTDLIGLQPEALYVQKGEKRTSEQSGVSVEETVRLDYIEVPILVKAVFAHRWPLKPSLFAGPAIAINLAAKDKALVGGQRIETDLKDDASPVDLSLAFGGAIEITAGDMNLFLDARYTMGLKPWSSIDDSRTGALAIGIGISVWVQTLRDIDQGLAQE